MPLNSAGTRALAQSGQPWPPAGGFFAAEISLFVGQLVNRCPGIQSIWAIGNRADGEVADLAGPFGWDLVAFADGATLRYLRNAADLHRADVLLRVVTDGDRFEAAWGKLQVSGSLFQWDWCQANGDEAYYSEARWKEGAQAGNVERTRRKATCLWQAERAGAYRRNPRTRRDGPA